MSDSTMNYILTQTKIDGLNITEALSRMGNSSKLYLRIIHSFVTNMPENLKELSTCTIQADNLPDYAIKIHGAKGSCYGIGANTLGDIALTLEMAAKAGDLETCLRVNDSFITSAETLIKQLEELETRIEEAEKSLGTRPQLDKPDTDTLNALLAATKDFDIDEMNRLVEELSSADYAHDGDVVDKIKQGIEAFDYQTIVDTITSYL